MFRRQIFYGITLILIVVIVFLLMRGRSVEKEQRAEQIKLAETASTPPSPIRAILPRDLEIVEAEVSWTRNPDGKDGVTALHNITIRNIGGGSYVSFWLRIEYIDEKNRPVEIRTYEIKEALSPGETLRARNIVIDALPDAALDFSAAILSADLDPDALN